MVFILVQKCPRLPILQLTRFTNTWGSIDSGNPSFSRDLTKARAPGLRRKGAAGPINAFLDFIKNIRIPTIFVKLPKHT